MGDLSRVKNFTNVTAIGLSSTTLSARPVRTPVFPASLSRTFWLAQHLALPQYAIETVPAFAATHATPAVPAFLVGAIRFTGLRHTLFLIANEARGTFTCPAAGVVATLTLWAIGIACQVEATTLVTRKPFLTLATAAGTTITAALEILTVRFTRDLDTLAAGTGGGFRAVAAHATAAIITAEFALAFGVQISGRLASATMVSGACEMTSASEAETSPATSAVLGESIESELELHAKLRSTTEASNPPFDVNGIVHPPNAFCRVTDTIILSW